jgi:hypothetical protein
MINLSRFPHIIALILLLNLVITDDLFSQDGSQFINYQAVARDANGEELSGVSLEVEFSIIEGAPQNNPTYIEQHSEVITDPFGLFVLKIGNGVPISGDYSLINWSESTFLNIQVNDGNGWVDLGTLQFVSVPYALFSSKADSANYGADEDADPMNEIQLITKVGDVVTLSNDGGSFIDEVEDADADSTNEYQSINKDGNLVTLSDNGGTFIDAVDDADADSTNEYQSINKVGNIVTLSDNGGSFTDEVNDADADASNEIQILNKVGSVVSLSNGGGNFTDEINDADSDSNNELISDLSYNSSNNLLTITESVSSQSVDLADLKEDQNWQANGPAISNSNFGNVGINEINPTSTLQIMGSTAVKVRVEGPSGSNYTLGDETIFIGKPDVGDVEVNLPVASTVPGRIYIIKKGDPSTFNDLKIHAAGSDLIEGLATYIIGDISGIYEQIMIVSDGVSDWWILSKD